MPPVTKVSPLPVAGQVVDPSENAAPNPVDPAQTRIIHARRFERMRQYFSERPKEWIRIRKEDGEQRVQINSYPFNIAPEVRVQVPVDVADLLRNKGVI